MTINQSLKLVVPTLDDVRAKLKSKFERGIYPSPANFTDSEILAIAEWKSASKTEAIDDQVDRNVINHYLFGKELRQDKWKVLSAFLLADKMKAEAEEPEMFLDRSARDAVQSSVEKWIAAGMPGQRLSDWVYDLCSELTRARPCGCDDKDEEFPSSSVTVRVNGENVAIDEGVEQLVRIFNTLPGIRVIGSCQGGIGPGYLTFDWNGEPGRQQNPSEVAQFITAYMTMSRDRHLQLMLGKAKSKRWDFQFKWDFFNEENRMMWIGPVSPDLLNAATLVSERMMFGDPIVLTDSWRVHTPPSYTVN